MSCTRLVDQHAARQVDLKHELAGEATSLQASVGRLFQGRHVTIEDIVEQLSHAAVTDEDISVRLSILHELHRASALSPFLAQPEVLRCLFIALNDEEPEVREIAIATAGTLCGTNPAYCLPVLRRYLMVTLSDVSNAPDVTHKAQSAALLGTLVKSAPGLAVSYVRAIATALLDQLRRTTDGLRSEEGVGVAKVLSQLLSTTATLATVAHSALQPYVDELIVIAIEVRRFGPHRVGHGKTASRPVSLAQVPCARSCRRFSSAGD